MKPFLEFENYIFWGMTMAYYKELDLPEEGVDLYESVHPKGEKVSKHYHDQYQILYALEGEGKITIDSEEFLFSKDRVVLVAPHSIHSIFATSKLTVLVLAFSKDALGSFVTKGLLEYFQASSKYYELDFVSASEVRQLLRKMLFEQTQYDVLCQFSSSVYLLETLIILIRHINYKKFHDANDMRALQIREYIHTHYFEENTAENLALRFGISARYMNDIFKGKFHETPLQYLQKVRINRAKELLLQTDKEIVSICFEVGYETLSTFYRTFRKLVGISPNKFRTTNKNTKDYAQVPTNSRSYS